MNIKRSVHLLTGLIVALALHQPLTGADAFYKEVTTEAGIALVAHNASDWVGPGVAWGDYDNDGDWDVYLVMGEGIPNALYRNNGNATFTDVAGETGVGDTGPGHGVYFVDYDNDGDSDLYVLHGLGNEDGGPQMTVTPNILYRNNGDGTFTDVTDSAGVDGVVDVGSSTSAAWADYDNDGLLDLYVLNLRKNIGEPNILYRNNGDGTFTDVTDSAGGGVNDPGMGLATGWGDIDNNGYLDLYVANDGGDGIGYNSKIFLNQGDGTFIDGTALVGLMDGLEIVDGNEMGVAFSDIDRDGWLDMYITNGIWFDEFGNMLFHNWLYMNDGDGTFTEVSEDAGVIGLDPSGLCTGWSTDIFDFDNDGEQDIYFANGNQDSLYDILYRNRGDGTFEDVTLTLGTLFRDNNRGAAFADFNHDGFVDILSTANISTARLFQNMGNANNFITVKTIGTVSNRDGIGARVRIRAGSLIQFEEINGGSGYLSMNDLPAEFGFGELVHADSIRVTWPASGIEEIATDVYLNQFVTFTEGSGMVYDDPFNIVIEPQSSTVVPGGELVLQVTLENHLSSPMAVEVDAYITLENGNPYYLVQDKQFRLAPNDIKSGEFSYPVPSMMPPGERRLEVEVRGGTFTDIDKVDFTVAEGGLFR